MSEEIIVTKVPATRWRNPLDVTISFTLNIAGVGYDDRTTYEYTDDRGKKHFTNVRPPQVKHVVLKPGEEIVLPAEFDSAIHGRKNPDGYVMSGLAPQLRRVQDGEPVAPRVHPALLGMPVAAPSRHVDSRAREAALRARRGT